MRTLHYLYNSTCIFSVRWQYTAQYKEKKAFVAYNKLRIWIAKIANEDKKGFEEEGSESVRLEPERQLNSGKQGLPGKENSIEQGGHDKVQKLSRHNWSARARETADWKSGEQGLPGGENSTEKWGHDKSQEARQAQVDANRSAQQHSRGFATPEARQACLQQDTTAHQRSKESGN